MWAGLDAVFSTVLEVARLNRVAPTDASYLELAKRRGLPFATRDGPLAKVAVQLGIELFQP